jgi:hypothetical protein
MQDRKIGAALAVAALAVAVVLFIILSGGSDSSGGADRTFAFKLANGEAAGGAEDVSATQGDHVTVTLQTDVPAELHVHGYELGKDVDAGKTGSIAFTAEVAGEFEIEAHHLVGGKEETGVELATLQVNP